MVPKVVQERIRRNVGSIDVRLMKYQRSIKGFTLIELMVVVALVALLASLAVPSYRSFLVNKQLSSASSDFLISMLQARSEAIRQGKRVSLLPSNGTDWTGGWYLTVVDSTCTASGTAFAESPALGPAVSIKTSSSNKSFAHSNPSFTYSATGFPVTSCGSPYYSGSMNGTLVFQAVETGRERWIIVSLSGRARICASDGGVTCSSD